METLHAIIVKNSADGLKSLVDDVVAVMQNPSFEQLKNVKNTLDDYTFCNADDGSELYRMLLSYKNYTHILYLRKLDEDIDFIQKRMSSIVNDFQKQIKDINAAREGLEKIEHNITVATTIATDVDKFLAYGLRVLKLILL